MPIFEGYGAFKVLITTTAESFQNNFFSIFFSENSFFFFFFFNFLEKIWLDISCEVYA